MKLARGFIGCVMFCVCVPVPVYARLADEVPTHFRDYLDSLVSESRRLGLAHKRGWRLLLHYREHRLSGKSASEVDGGEFFLAPTVGKYDSAAELEATLAAFFTERKLGRHKQAPQCAFPARYHWLKTQLGFDPKRMPLRECRLIEAWRERINAESVSLIFASYYFNNPASMFGHTFLRINSADDAQPRLLDFAISYAAVTDDVEGFFDYAWNGITGGFEGRFSVYPYYDMVKLYNDLENRDLWEYKLNLSQQQIDFMLLHAWELVNTHFDFYFLRENCSYHLLSLLEVADPELDFRQEYLAWTLPTDTVKQVNEQKGLVDSVVRRSSSGSRLENRLRELNDRERKLVEALVEDIALAESAELNRMPPDRRTKIIDTAIGFLQYRKIANGNETSQQKEKLHGLLFERSKLPMASIDIAAPSVQHKAQPDQGHDPIRIAISAGQFRRDDDFDDIEDEFIDFSVQPGFHDLLSSNDGHAPNSQIRFLGLSARYLSGDDDWQVSEFALVDIISLSPLSLFQREPSWKLDIGWQRNLDGGCADCTPFILNPGIGLSLQSNLLRKEVYFVYLDAKLEFDHEFDGDRRGGFGVTAGLLVDLSDRWRIAVIADRTRYTAGQEGYVSRLEFKQRYYLSRNLEFVFDLTSVEDYREANLGLAYYF